MEKISKTLICSILAVVLAVSVKMPMDTVSASSSNLLTNGNAEAGSLTGWTQTGQEKKWEATDGDNYGNTCVPHSGKYFFWPVNTHEETTLYQDVNASSYVGKTVTLSLWMAVWPQSPTDEAKASLIFLNSSGSEISSKTLSNATAEWKQFSVTETVPGGTSKIRVKLFGKNNNGVEDWYFDDVFLSVSGGSSSTVPAATEKSKVTKATASNVATIKVGNNSKVTAYVGDIYKLRSSISNVKWYSGKTSVATVTTDGVLSCLKKGTAKITGKVNGATKITFTLTCKDAKLIDGYNSYGVSNGAKLARLKAGKKLYIKSMDVYHWNGGKGKKPGTITIYKADSKYRIKSKIKTFKAIGTGNNTNWNITVNLTLPKGYYVIKTSSPKTWSYNSRSNNYGFIRCWCLK
jgi:hypothetical protein